jgi:hypothetical protein
MNLTLAHAAVIASDRCMQDLSMKSLIVDEATKTRTIDTWLWLLGLDTPGSDSSRVEAARREVSQDGELFLMLNLPAAELLDWFRREDWALFDCAELFEGEQWAWAIIDRVRGFIGGVGCYLAGQVPARPPGR